VIRPYARDSVSVELTGGDGAYEVAVRDASSGRDVGRGLSQSHTGAAVVRFEPQPGRRYAVRVRRADGGSEKGKAPRAFHLTVLGGRLQYAHQQGSIPFPGDGTEVVAVSAV